MPRRLLIALLAFLLVAPAASASNLVDRNAKNVQLKVNSEGVALVTYKAKGIQRHVIYWGAEGDTPEFFRYDRSGGAVSKKVKDWRTLKNVCGPYPGPEPARVVAACTMSDGIATGRSRTGSASRRTTAARTATRSSTSRTGAVPHRS